MFQNRSETLDFIQHMTNLRLSHGVLNCINLNTPVWLTFLSLAKFFLLSRMCPFRPLLHMFQNWLETLDFIQHMTNLRMSHCVLNCIKHVCMVDVSRPNKILLA